MKIQDIFTPQEMRDFLVEAENVKTIEEMDKLYGERGENHPMNEYSEVIASFYGCSMIGVGMIQAICFFARALEIKELENNAKR